MTKNGSTPWGPIKEIPAKELERKLLQRGTWEGLWGELLLRLERTPPSAALEVPFEDPEMGKRAYDALKRHCGTRVLINSRQDGNGGRTIYVRRGPTWSQQS